MPPEHPTLSQNAIAHSRDVNGVRRLKALAGLRDLGDHRVTDPSLKAVLEKLNIDPNSFVVHLGGNSSYLIAALSCCAVAISVGLDGDPNKVGLALADQRHLLDSKEEATREAAGRAEYAGGSIESLETLFGATHVYMLDVTFPQSILDRIATLFNASTVQYIVSYKNPKTIIGKCGFLVEHYTSVSAALHGSGERLTAYVYIRSDPDQLGGPPVNLQDIDPLFQPGYEAVKAGATAVHERVVARCDEWLHSGRTPRSGRTTGSKRKFEAILGYV